MSKQPNAFVPGQGGSYRPAPVQVSQTHEVRAPYIARGPANAEPILSVSNTGRCTLTKTLLAVANLRGGRPVRLVVPRQRGGAWYLDTNPKPGDGTCLPVKPGRAALIRVGPIPPTHFQVSRPSEPGFVAGSLVNTQVALLHFRLGPEVPGHPGYYQLLRGLSTTTPA